MTSPEVGLSSELKRCSKVDLPEPLGPVTAQNSPCSNETVTWSTAFTTFSPLMYSFVRSLHERMLMGSLLYLRFNKRRIDISFQGYSLLLLFIINRVSFIWVKFVLRNRKKKSAQQHC